MEYKLISMRLDDAEKLLTADGVKYSVCEIHPFFKAEAVDKGGVPRVIRQDYKDGVLILTVCRVL